MATTNEPVTDIRAQHRDAVARLREAEAKVRELNACLVSERIELFQSHRGVHRVPLQGWPGQHGTVVVGQEVEGSRRVDVHVDPLVRAQAMLDLPVALRALRQAQVDEAKLRPLVEALDVEEKRQAKLRLLPRVAKAYDALDRALVHADKLRGAVAAAIQAVGEVSPTDATVSAAFAWPELNMLDLRRQQIRAWTQQASGSGAST